MTEQFQRVNTEQQFLTEYRVDITLQYITVLRSSVCVYASCWFRTVHSYRCYPQKLQISHWLVFLDVVAQKAGAISMFSAVTDPSLLWPVGLCLGESPVLRNATLLTKCSIFCLVRLPSFHLHMARVGKSLDTIQNPCAASGESWRCISFMEVESMVVEWLLVFASSSTSLFCLSVCSYLRTDSLLQPPCWT